MAERYTTESEVTEMDMLTEVFEMANGSYLKPNEVTTNMVASLLEVTRHRAYDILEELVGRGLLTRRPIKGDYGGNPNAYAPVTTWAEIREILSKESPNGSKTVGRSSRV